MLQPSVITPARSNCTGDGFAIHGEQLQLQFRGAGGR
jgi:hypothetical protein